MSKGVRSTARSEPGNRRETARTSTPATIGRGRSPALSAPCPFLPPDGPRGLEVSPRRTCARSSTVGDRHSTTSGLLHDGQGRPHALGPRAALRRHPSGRNARPGDRQALVRELRTEPALVDAEGPDRPEYVTSPGRLRISPFLPCLAETRLARGAGQPEAYNHPRASNASDVFGILAPFGGVAEWLKAAPC